MHGDSPPRTLGDLLYADPSSTLESEEVWRDLVRSAAGGDQRSLHGLYERAHRPVFTLLMRILRSRESAEEVTVDVFHDAWRRAGSYDPDDGTVLGWIMNQARSRAIDRLRFDNRKKRDPGNGAPEAPAEPRELNAVIDLKQQSVALRAALVALPVAERVAIEEAFFTGSTYAEVATRLNQPIGTVKTRIRSALHRLRKSLAAGDTR
jgi:RNA polymerase sigma-70 factor, ECF subfamily